MNVNHKAIDDALKNVNAFFAKAKQGVKLFNLTDNQGYAARAILNSIQNDGLSYTAIEYICCHTKEYLAEDEAIIIDELKIMLKNFDYDFDERKNVYAELEDKELSRSLLNLLKNKWKTIDIKPVTKEAYIECVDKLTMCNDELKCILCEIYEEDSFYFPRTCVVYYFESTIFRT